VHHLPVPAPRRDLGIAVGQDSVHFLLTGGGPAPKALSALILWSGFSA
jgi:hypothetical protein